MNKIFENYSNPSLPGSFSGLSGFLKNNKENKEKTEEELLKHDSFTLHNPIRRKFTRNRVIVGGIDHTWQADLVDVHQLKYQNKHNNYILTCIDVFSKYAWAIPIKTKTAANTRIGFEQILSNGRIPQNIYIDGGNEFKGVCKDLLKKLGIEIFITKSKYKACVVERFNRTLKEKMWRVFTENQNKKYIEILPQLLESYNNSYHRSIKTTPSKVSIKNQKHIFKNLYGYEKESGNDNLIKINFKIGDYVRISIDKNIFEKGYTANWSKEVYVIKKILLKTHPIYKLASLNGEDLDSFFYEKELQKVNVEEFPYNTYEIVKEEKNKILAKQINSEDHKEIWIDKPTSL